MTNAMQLPDFPDRLIPDDAIPNDAIPDSEMPAREEGTILQRGGEALRLEQCSDRITIALNRDLVLGDVSSDDIAEGLNEISEKVGAEVVQAMASVGLIELQVSPDRLDMVMQSLRREKKVRFASHVYYLQKSPGTPIYVTNQITVQFAAGVTADHMKTIAAAHGIEVFKLVPGVSKAFVFILTPEAVVNPVKLANRLLDEPAVLMAEPNIVVPVQQVTDPGTDPLHASGHQPEHEIVSQDEQNQEAHNQDEHNQKAHNQDEHQPDEQGITEHLWHLHHHDGEMLALGSLVSANAAWEITQGARSIVVAIADDAIDISQPAFCGEGKIVAPVDFGSSKPLDKRESDTSISPPALSPSATFCAGLAVAEENPSTSIGVAPGCALMPIAMGQYLDDQIIEQVCEWALDKGAAVLNFGWSASAIYFPLSLRQQAAITRVATQGRNGKGCVVVVAAGNANRPLNGVIDEGQSEPGAEQSGGKTHWLNGLAVHPDVITVSAITRLNRKAAYSNWGTGISVCAPSNTHTLSWGGTSAACAIVSGVAALVLSANPDLTAREVKQLLQQTADKIIDSEPDPQLGLQHGTYNVRGYSQWFGYGKVNALRAVQSAHAIAQQTIKRLGTSTRSIKQHHSQIIDIPDCDTHGTTSVIEIEETGFLRTIEISVDVEHSFMGDLEILLIPPKGMTVLLQGRSSGRSTVLRKTYSLQTTPLLKKLLNQPVAGRWQLKLVDHVPLNTGQLKSWTLHLGL